MSTQTLQFTDSAANKVAQLIKEENNAKLNLRVFVTGGGCAGFQYGFTFDEAVAADDVIVEKQVKEGEGDGGESGGTTTVKLLVDPMSFQYLKEAEIDYKRDLQGEHFVIRNPNVKTTCGCGSSFAA